jgi:hypothetical protein
LAGVAMALVREKRERMAKVKVLVYMVRDLGCVRLGWK